MQEFGPEEKNVNVRIPVWLWGYLKVHAELNRRSFNSEILSIVEKHLDAFERDASEDLKARIDYKVGELIAMDQIGTDGAGPKVKNAVKVKNTNGVIGDINTGNTK